MKPSRNWLIVFLVYVAVFGTILVASKGLPYPIDNNESFSSLWHARNLDHVDFSATKGLADEVFSWSRSASPYVHTHQGNFPRIFAYLLFLLGIRSIQGQIIVTTFTVGLTTLWFAYRFLSRITTPLFATVACLILITDYALFGQWQTNTYRIWYGFFFFSSLWWVRGLADSQRPRVYLLLGIADFCAMFYGEYVFAAFVGLTAGCYACWCYRQAGRTMAKGIGVIVIGGGMAAAVLLSQLVAYMGMENLKRDITYTLSARNMAEDHHFAERVGKFYAEHDVIFWQNYFDVTHLRTIAEVANSFLNYHLAFYGKWIPIIASILLLAWLTTLLFPIEPATGKGSTNTLEARPFFITIKSLVIGLSAYRFLFILLGQLAWIPVSHLTAIRTAPDRVVLTWAPISNATYELDLATNEGGFNTLGSSSSAVYAVGDLSQSALYRIRVHSVVDGVSSPWHEVPVPLLIGAQDSASDFPLTLLIAVLSCCFTVALLREWSRYPGKIPPSWIRIASGAIYLLVTGKMILSRGAIFDGPFQKNWILVFGPTVAHWVGPIFSGFGVLCGLGIILDGTPERTSELRDLRPLVSATICVTIAYLLTYRIFTGYIYSGYLVRQAPFLVFWTDILVAVAPYILIVAVYRNFAPRIAALRRFVAESVAAFHSPSSPFTDAFRAALQLPAQVPFLCAIALLGGFAVTWLTLQGTYISLAPPTGYGFLSLLTKPPMKGGSFVVNNYPAPMAEMTHSWAYAESSIFSGQLKLGANGFSVQHDNKYLWFADAATNREYLRPKFGLLVSQPASLGEAIQRRIDRPLLTPPSAIAFADSGMVARSQDPLQPFLKYRLLNSDVNSFALVQFDWDFPPYLRPVDCDPAMLTNALSIGQKIALNVESRALRRRWRIEIEPNIESNWASPDGATNLLSATIDGTEVFSAKELFAAGWSRSPISGIGSIEIWKGFPGRAKKLSAVVKGDKPELVFTKGPEGGKAEVQVNEMSGLVDLKNSEIGAIKFGFSSDQPHGKNTFVPDFAPGLYVETAVGHDGNDNLAARVRYRYVQQDKLQEENSVIRVYYAADGETFYLDDSFTLVGALGVPVRLDDFRRLNPDLVKRFVAERHTDSFTAWLNAIFETEPLTRLRPGVVTGYFSLVAVPGMTERMVPLPPHRSGRFQLSVSPSTQTKRGTEYFGLPFDVKFAEVPRPGAWQKVEWNALPPATWADFPYGKISVRVIFPANRMFQAEPIISSGVTEAGDFVYVIYVDATHIRLGFDHWFKGGVLTRPINVDYHVPHEIEVSMGSLYPSNDDVMFANMSSGYIEGLKRTVSVKIDGHEWINERSDCYESTPEQILVGKNQIRGTTSNPLFTGSILDIKRVWPGEN